MSHGNTTAPGYQATLPGTPPQPSSEDPSPAACPEEHVQTVHNAVAPSVTDGNVENVNVGSSIGTEIDVKQLSADVDWADLPPREGYTRLSFAEVPDANIRLSRSGHLSITGAVSASEIITAVELTHQHLRGLGIETEWCEIDVNNVVVTFTLPGSQSGSRVNLNAVSVAFGTAVEYEPETFTAAVYSQDEDPGTCLIFTSGAVTVTGAESTRAAAAQQSKLCDRLAEHGLIE